jgi:hypothetical protein
MYNYPPPVSLWSVWPHLTAWEKLFLLALVGLCAYVLFSVAITVRLIREIRTAIREGNSAEVKSIFVTLRSRSTSIQKLIETAFYLFGMVLFLSFQWAYVILETSSSTVESLVLRNLVAHFVFAFHVFFVLLVLHLLSWIVSNFIDRFGLELKR